MKNITNKILQWGGVSKVLFTLILALTLISSSMSGYAQEAYAVVNDGALTFYYDNNKPINYISWERLTRQGDYTTSYSVDKLVFDQSFKNFKPTTCAYLCSHFNYITEIVGMKENLNSDDVTDMTSMFSGCCLLKTIDLSGFNTSKVTSMDFLFYNCRNLRAIFVDDNWNTSSVYQNTDLFASCNKLFGGKGTSVYDVGVYNDISYAQVDKGSSNPGFLTKYGDPVFSTQVPYVLVEGNTATFYYGYEPDGALYAMAEGWPNATDITKVVFDESFKNFKPKSYANLFNGLKKLTEIKGMDQNLNSELVTDMRYMFMHCESLQSIDLSWANTANVYYMNYMFYGCGNLKSIFVNENWSTSALKESTGYFFVGCEKLYGGKGTSVNDLQIFDDTYAKIDGGTNNPGYFTKSGEPAFVGNYPYVEVKDGVATFFYKPEESQESLPLPIKIQSIGNNDCVWTDELRKSITQVVFDESFKDYKPTSCEHWFYNFENLTSIIGMKDNLNTELVTAMYDMFTNCYSLTTLDLSGFKTQNVINMFSMFENCKSLKSIFVGDGWLLSSLKDADDMFLGCSKLFGGQGSTPLKLNKYDATCAKVDGGAEAPGYFTKSGEPAYINNEPYAVIENNIATFYYNDSKPDKALPLRSEENDDNWLSSKYISITKVVFDESFKNYKPYKTSLWFWGFEKLTEITGIENLNTEDLEYMSEMFQFCDNLKSVDLSGFNTSKVTDMTRLFWGCNNLESVFVGEGWNISAVKKSSGMFEDCFKLHGGKGTAYNASITDITYAKIDGGTDNPGYLTKSGEPAFKKSAVSIEISTNPKTEYTEGDNFSAANGKLTVKYNDNTSEIIDLSAATITGYDKNKAGEQTLKIEYDGASIELKVTVNAKMPTPVSDISNNQGNIKVWASSHTIFIVNAPTDTEYKIIDTNGRVLTTSKTKSTHEEIKINKSGVLIVIIDNQSFKVIN